MEAERETLERFKENLEAAIYRDDLGSKASDIEVAKELAKCKELLAATERLHKELPNRVEEKYHG